MGEPAAGSTRTGFRGEVRETVVAGENAPIAEGEAQSESRASSNRRTTAGDDAVRTCAGDAAIAAEGDVVSTAEGDAVRTAGDAVRTAGDAGARPPVPPASRWAAPLPPPWGSARASAEAGARPAIVGDVEGGACSGASHADARSSSSHARSVRSHRVSTSTPRTASRRSCSQTWAVREAIWWL